MTVMPIHPHLSYLGDQHPCRLLLRVADVAGSSTLDGYEDWIPVDAVSTTWALPADDAVGKGRRRRAITTPGRVVLRLPFDQSGPYLVLAAMQGKAFARAELHHVVDGEPRHVPLRHEFDHVLFVGARSDAVSALPVLQVELAYESMRMTWTEVGLDGATSGKHEVEYDVAAGA